MKKIFTERGALVLIVIGGLIAVIGLIYFSAKRVLLGSVDGNLLVISAEKAGDIGSIMSGVVGIFWSLAGVILFYVSLSDQRKDIETNRRALEKQIQEFELQRDELRLTREVYLEQSKTQKLQQFESTFFNFLNSHQKIVSSLVFDRVNRVAYYQDIGGDIQHKGIVTGSDVFDFAAEDFYLYYIKDNNLISPRIIIKSVWDVDNEPIPDHNHPLERIKHKYRRFFEIYHNQLGHYFRHLFHILSFLERSWENEKALLENMTTEEQNRIKEKYMFYANIVQANLSSAEMFLLFYNGLCFPKLKPLLEKFDILENLATEDLLRMGGDHTTLYNTDFKSRRNIMA